MANKNKNKNKDKQQEQVATCPDGYPKAAWDKLTSIEANTELALERLGNLESRVEALEKREDPMENPDVQLLAARISRMEVASARLRDEVRDLKKHSMKNNLIFTFDNTTDHGKEIEGEDTIAVIRGFLTQVMRVPGADKFYIPVAHRVGGSRRGFHRAIVVKLPIASQLDLVLRHGNRLKDTRHGVSRQTPPAFTERRQFAMDVFKAKKTDPKNKARLTDGKLFVKGKLQTRFLEPSLPDPDPVDSDAEDMDIVESKVVKDSGSVFKSYAVSVNSLPDVKAGINDIMTQPDVSRQSHFIYAYRVKDGNQILENFQSDDDHGMGLDLLRLLRQRDDTDVLCVVTRDCAPNFLHLGRKRFDHLQCVGNDALDKL